MKKKKTKRDPMAAKDAQRTAAAVSAVKADLRSVGSSDQAFGTGNSAMGAVKMASEESRLQSCVECGSSGGRHMRICSHYVPPEAA